MTEAEQLRQSARQIRNSAMHAERLQDARSELARAQELEYQADVLEGKTLPVVKRLTADEIKAAQAQSAAARAARIDNVATEMLERFRR